jgi:hypothetical protein
MWPFPNQWVDPSSQWVGASLWIVNKRFLFLKLSRLLFSSLLGSTLNVVITETSAIAARLFSESYANLVLVARQK